MCRLIAHWGPPIAVSGPLAHAPHSLQAQSRAALQQTSGCDNPDGWGIGWYVDGQAEPFRFRTTTPMASDDEGLAALEGLVSARFVAHVRLKSPGSPTEVAGNAPFISGRWMFAHNGFVEGYREGVRQELWDRVSPRRAEAIEGDADSEVLFALILDRLDAGDAPIEAIRAVVPPLAAHGGRYNIVLTDGEQLLATRVDNSLHLRRGDGAEVELASEPYDDEPGWEPVPDQTILRVDAGGVAVEPL